MRKLCALIMLLFTGLTGCEDINLRLATEAGKDAVKALTLSDEEVQQLSSQARVRMDREHRIAPPESQTARRLRRLVREHRQEGEADFNYQVYLSPKVNAFALGDGSIRIYSGLMDMMSDQELLFVIGHEMGHVLEEHVREKMAVALATSALRKGVASQENIVGDLAGSLLGAFIQKVVNARFSQEEEKQADDYALRFMQREGYDPHKAVSALEKLASLGGGHSFLSSHPAPQARADRLQERLAGTDAEERDTGLLAWLLDRLKAGISWLAELLGRLADALGKTEAVPAGN